MLEKAVDLAVEFWTILRENGVHLAVQFWTIQLEIAAWLLAGPWYADMFALLSTLGALAIIRQIHLGVSGVLEVPCFFLTATVLVLATLFWLSLMAAAIRLACFS